MVRNCKPLDDGVTTFSNLILQFLTSFSNLIENHFFWMMVTPHFETNPRLLEIPNLDATRNRPQGNHDTLSEDDFWFSRCFSCTGQFLVSAMWFATFIGWFALFIFDDRLKHAKHIQTCWYLMCGRPENRGNWQTSINLRVAEFRVQHFDLSDKSADWLSALWHIMALFKTGIMVLGTKTWSEVVQIILLWVHRL